MIRVLGADAAPDTRPIEAIRSECRFASEAGVFYGFDHGGCGEPDGLAGGLISATKALRLIVDAAEVVQAGAFDYLVIPATPELIDALAAFEADAEDAEDDDPAEDGHDSEWDEADRSGIGDLDGLIEQCGLGWQQAE